MPPVAVQRLNGALSPAQPCAVLGGRPLLATWNLRMLSGTRLSQPGLTVAAVVGPDNLRADEA